MKELIKRILTTNLLAASVLCSPAAASEFSLPSLTAAGLRGGELQGAAIPKAGAPTPADELIGGELNVSVPIKLISRLMLTVDELSIIDPAAPVLLRSGEVLNVLNIRLNINGIVLEPLIALKPYLEGTDKLAVKVMHVRLHASASPTPGAQGAPESIPTPPSGSEFNIEDTMADVMGIITKGIRDAINEKLRAGRSELTSEDIINSEYDKAAWTLHAKVSPAVLKRFLDDSVVSEIHMTGFGFTNDALLIKFGSGQ